MVSRQGLGKGRGKGYKNLIPKDPRVHKESRMGIKQPQRIKKIVLDYRDERMIPISDTLVNIKGQLFLTEEDLKKMPDKVTVNIDLPEYQVDSDGDGVPDFMDCNPSDPTKQHLDVTKVPEIVPKDGSQVTKPRPKSFFKRQLDRGKELLKKQAEARKEERLRQIKDVDHPRTIKLRKQEDRVKTAESHFELAKDPDKREDLLRELKEEQRQLRELQEEVSQIRLEDFSDGQLRNLAIRHKGTFSIFGSGNPYKDEILRRDRARVELKKEERETIKKAKEPSRGLFD